MASNRQDCTRVNNPMHGAGKWADNPEAFRKMKAALGVQLAQALESSFGLDAEASEDYVDVLTDGFAIRLFLFSNRCAAQAVLHVQLFPVHPWQCVRYRYVQNLMQ